MTKISKNKVQNIIIDTFDENVLNSGFAPYLNLTIINSIFKSAGSLSIERNLDKATINVNLSKIDRRKGCDDVNYQVYQTVAHEIEHAKTIFATQSNDFYSYEHMMALMEYLNYANMFKVDFYDISMGLTDAMMLRKQLNRNYDLSSSEIIANLASYSGLYNRYEMQLTQDKEDTLKTIISSLNFLNDNIEVHYNEFGEPMNRFVTFARSTSSYIVKNPKVCDKFKVLGHLFNNDGSVKSLYEIYSNINESNKNMYRRIMIGYLTSIDSDYSQSLLDTNFKQYMEELISEYINSTIDYHKNLNQGSLFVRNKQALIDNLLIKKNNIKILNDLVKKYDLTLTSGTIIDSNNVYRKRMVK